MSSPTGVQLLVAVLTLLAGVSVVLTRRRLAAEDVVAGRAQVGGGVPRVHTVAGLLALVLWVVFLVLGERAGELTAGVLGIVAVGLWWVTAGAGLMLLARWLPSRGRHAGEGRGDAWSSGPALSALAHLGTAGCVLVFTWAYLTHAV